MNSNTEMIIDNRSTVFNLVGWVFGITVFAVGLLNTFWGNDPGFGVFLLLLSAVYLPPVNVLLREKFRLSIPAIVKILLGIFIFIAALGVGELFGKIDLMMKDF